MIVRELIAELVSIALERAQSEQILPETSKLEVVVEKPQNPTHGDFATSVALKLAKPMRKSPLQIAEIISANIPDNDVLEKIWAAPPGFVNVTLNPYWLSRQIDTIRMAGPNFGDTDVGNGQTVQIEFVSVNPTGPVHIGHARGAVIGSALANILSAAGFNVVREYYFNDAGNQMNRFNQSLMARYQQLHGIPTELPIDGYMGDYMIELAHDIQKTLADKFVKGDEESVIELGQLGLKRMIEEIRTDMESLRVKYDVWFNESSLFKDGQFDKTIQFLQDRDLLTERDGAKWFRSSALGDEQDKVVIRSNGAPTYFGTDIAYHYNKFFERKFDKVIDVLGADHQGHVRFMKVLTSALGIDTNRLTLLVHQMVSIKSGDTVIRASKRTGDLLTLRELINEVGIDPCRFFFLSRAAESQIEFDTKIAKAASSENPVYYIQYAYARTSSILRLARDQGIEFDQADVSLLTHETELSLIRKMLELPELIEMIAGALEPHHLPHYATELATSFHIFYQQCRVISSEPSESELTKARLKLVNSAKIVLSKCLSLMLMAAPNEM